MTVFMQITSTGYILQMASTIPSRIVNTSVVPPVAYRVEKLLGKGGFADCHRVVRENDCRVFAVKVTQKKMFNKKKGAEARLRMQIDLLRKYKHRHVIRFIDSFEDSTFLYMVLELCEKISMLELVRNRRRLTEVEVRFYIRQLVDGMSYLKKKNIVHRDIKVCNILLTANMDAKIADFGLAISETVSSQNSQPICGTPNYMAPEIIEKLPFSFEVDAWSLGVLIFNLAYGRCPFAGSDQKQTYNNILKVSYTFPEVACNVSNQLKDLIHRLLQKEPKERITLEEIYLHQFMRGPLPQLLPGSCYKQEPQISNLIYMKIEPPRSIIVEKWDKAEEEGKYIKIQEDKLAPQPPLTSKMKQLLSKYTYILNFEDDRSKSGFYFQLSNGFYVGHFNDHTKMALSSQNGSVFYLEELTQKINQWKNNHWPKEKSVSMKKSSMIYFALDYPAKTVSREENGKQMLKGVQSWVRIKKAYMFTLKNLIQMQYWDHSTIFILRQHAKVIYLEEETARMFNYPIQEEEKTPQLREKVRLLSQCIKIRLGAKI